MMNIDYFKQPTGNTCGPACIKMAINYFATSFDSTITPSIEKIAEMCGTDWIVGTPPDRMEKGMQELGLKYIEYVCPPRPYELLRSIIEIDHIPILRTITQGIPHWIIMDGYNFVYPDRIRILDPWLGKIEYTEKELDAIWKVRNYQFFETYAD